MVADSGAAHLMTRGDIMKNPSGLRLLLVSAVRAYSAAYSRAASREFSRRQTPMTASGLENPSSRKVWTPDFRLWSEARIEACQSSPVGCVPPAALRLRIRAIL